MPRHAYTDHEKLRCVERELKFRNHTYPRRVVAGRMTQQQADREIYLMEDIAADYTAKVRADEPGLFEPRSKADRIDYERDHKRALRNEEG